MSERDPNGYDPHQPGAKLDDGKVMAGVLDDFSLALMAVAEVGTFGAKKYTRGGWQSVPNGQERYRDALWRHHLSERHEPKDPETGLLHKAHKAWNALAELELELRGQRQADELQQETFAPLDELPPAPEPLDYRHTCNNRHCPQYGEVWDSAQPVEFCPGCKQGSVSKPSYRVNRHEAEAGAVARYQHNCLDDRCGGVWDDRHEVSECLCGKQNKGVRVDG